VPVALALGLSLIAVAIAVVLSRPPLVAAGIRMVPGRSLLAYQKDGRSICQGDEALPQGTVAVRLGLGANVGPRVEFAAFSGARVLTRGVRGAGWGIDETVTVPVRRVARTVRNVRVCTTVGPEIEPIEIHEASVPGRAVGAGGQSGLKIEYLRPASGSWLSMLAPIARNMGFGHAPGGVLSVLLLVALMAAVVALVSLMVIHELGAADREDEAARRLLRVPAQAWVCALVAFLSAASWSLLTPPFQVTDEPSHFAYVQRLAETGRLPTSGESNFSPAEEIALRGLLHSEVLWYPEHRTISSRAQQRALGRDLDARSSRVDAGDAGVAHSQPPLYYALELLPYFLGSGGTLLDQLELMRLLSALLASLTALFAYMFVREALPRLRWSWTVGGLTAALAPLLGLMAGSVNPDAMLCSVSACLLYLLARGFRRGLTRGVALALGAVAAIGFLTKLNFVGLAPGMLLGLVLLAFRARRGVAGGGPLRRPGLRSVCRRLALALAVAFSPVAVYAAINVLSRRPTFGFLSRTLSTSQPHESLLSEIFYAWQLYLPRLPGMTNDFPGVFTTREVWFDRGVGLYGWLDTSFPPWVDNLALILAAPIAVFAVSALWAARASLRGRLSELTVYAVIACGMLALVGVDSYRHLATEGGGYMQPRYLLPMLPLLAAALTLSARGAGRRWGPVAGTAIVLLLLAHDIFSQLLTISRFYV
jgi:hypothetical protein